MNDDFIGISMTVLLSLILSACVLESGQHGQTVEEDSAPGCESSPDGLYGLCNAYCEAMNCDDPDHHASDRACEQVLENYLKRSGGELPSCGDGAPEEPPVDPDPCDGVDNDGDGQIDEGHDLDGDGVARCCEPGEFFTAYNVGATAIEAWMSNGDGTFTKSDFPIAESSVIPPRTRGIGDFDNNGSIDVIWADTQPAGGPKEHFMTTCDGEWQTTALGAKVENYYGGGDANNDGNKDLFSLDITRSGNVIDAQGHTALGDGSGQLYEHFNTFDPSVLVGAWEGHRAYNLADMNGDGNVDLMIHKYAHGGAATTVVYLLPGNGDGTFQNPQYIASISSQPQNYGDLGDIDGDGCADWLGAGDDDGDKGSVRAMLGDCTGNFSAPFELLDTCDGCYGSGSLWGRGYTQLYDWDGDGDLDLLTGMAVTSSTAVIEYRSNDGHGNFSGPSQVAGTSDLSSYSVTTPLRN